MSNVKDKVILITGSTDGIGQQTARDLAQMGAHIIVHGRNEAKARLAAERIISETGNRNVDSVYGDLSIREEILFMSEFVHQEYGQIDVLINNAGVIKSTREVNADGYEMTFAVNHLSYFLLTGMLLDLLRKSDYSRIINVASQAHASKLDFDNHQGEDYYESYDAYSRSKLCNILFTYQLARMLGTQHTSVNALHPGVISTKLLHAGWGSGGGTLKAGSETSVYLAAAVEVAGISGKYFSKKRAITSHKISYDVEVQERLWALSEQMTGFIYKI